MLKIFSDEMALDERADLKAVLAAWHGATLRLEQTHETLQSEVRRLTDELAFKNRELARKNRLADLGQMAAHVAHEVRNNLVPVSLYLSLLRRRLAGSGDLLSVLEKVEAGFLALDSTVNDLLQFTSDRDPRCEHMHVDRLIDGVVDALRPQLDAQHITPVTDVPHKLFCWADSGMVRRAVLNLALNALDAMPNGGTLTFTAVGSPRGLELEVADSGPGLSEDVRRRAFEPFFTTKPGGTGLGLAIVYRVAEVHGGCVTAQNCPEGGAAFTLTIPLPAREAAA